jgi:predicted transposase/invertase (TIGR01784 family)
MMTPELREMLIEVGYAAEWEQMALAKGLEEGLEKGREEGREREQLEVARNMLADGLDVSLISRYTGLPHSKIEELLLN